MTLVSADPNAGCPLGCIHGGECRLARSRKESEQGHYCHCRSGYIGIRCEIVYRTCTNRTDTCFNGDPCIRDVDMDGQTFYRCECNGLLSDLTASYAGALCHKAPTQVCGSHHSHYCANSGQCQKSSMHGQESCTCAPGWSGTYCTMPTNHPYHALAAEHAHTVRLHQLRLGMSILILVVVAAYFVGLVFYGGIGSDDDDSDDSHRRRAPRRRRRRMADHVAPIPSTVVMEQEMVQLQPSGRDPLQRDDDDNNNTGVNGVEA
jgi:hypothetical protein